MNKMTAIPQNYKNNVEWILGAYEDAGVTFPNGFQKDAIQNAVGARKTNKWKNWSCNISVCKTDKGEFVIVEDSGTMGLTGANIPAEDINKLMAAGETLDSTQRLARFTSMFNSGGNATGGGLFGAGKSVYSVASNTYTYYFDSLREDGLYVANMNKCGQVQSVALENDEAKNFIYDFTGLAPKQNVGTRVIIESPKKELVESISNGDIVSYIQESWWLIIKRLDEGASISVNGKMVKVPSEPFNVDHIFELQNSEKYMDGYRVKHFGLYVSDTKDSMWHGISYYRKGMKIGDVDLKDIPEKINKKFWGYIEVDEAWEDGLSEIEDRVHFGVSKGKKNSKSYQNLKAFCNQMVQSLLIKWGYIKNQEYEDKKLKDNLTKIAEELQDLFGKLGYENLGIGPKKPDFDVRWQDIKYPSKGSEQVTSGDEIKFSMRITSSYTIDKKFAYSLYVLSPNSGEIISYIDKDEIIIKPSDVFKKEFSHVINTDSSLRYSENRIILSVKVIGSGKEKKKELPYFYDINKPDNTRESVSLSLHECTFPIEGSRRVNFDDSITNVCYRIENKRNYTLNYKLNISIHNVMDNASKITDVGSFSGILNPFEEIFTPYIDHITFARNIYEKYLNEGIIQLRARLIANEDDEQFEKGDKITSYNLNIYLNMDDKNGQNDAFEVQSIDAPENYKRAWNQPGVNRTIYLNIGHAAYHNMEAYPDLQMAYLREQMLKQYVLLYLSEGRYDMFGDIDNNFLNLEPQEAAEQVLEKIEKIYYKSLE